MSVCLPRDPKKLFKISEYVFQGDLSMRADVWDKITLFNEIQPLSKEEGEITKLIANLINGVTEMKALEDLRNLL